MRHVLGLGLVVGGMGLAAFPAAAADDLGRFVGTYVGRAEEVGPRDRTTEQRDIDLVIAPHGKDGLSISWTNVTLVDGRRDVPGVRRRADHVHLAPASDRSFYLAREQYDPFSEREAPEPIRGDPVRWATAEGDVLRTYSFVILEDGRYELQTYARALDADGVTLDWQRVVDGATVRRMVGRTVRAE